MTAACIAFSSKHRKKCVCVCVCVCVGDLIGHVGYASGSDGILKYGVLISECQLTLTQTSKLSPPLTLTHGLC